MDNETDELRSNEDTLELTITRDKNTDRRNDKIDAEIEEQPKIDTEKDAEFDRLGKALTLCIAYAANVGGTGSLIGTAPNIVLVQFLDRFYEGLPDDNPVNFASWFMFGLPVSFICLFVIWGWMQIYFLRCKGFTKCREDKYGQAARKVVGNEIKKLGKMKFAEWATLLNFIVIVVVWFFYKPRFMTGWAALFPKGYVNGTSAVVFFTTIMFVFPSEIPRIFCCRRGNEQHNVKPLLNWKIVHEGVPWMIVWLLGGGFALAKGSEISGLSVWIGNELMALSYMKPWALLLVLTFITAAITEITSNTAIATIFLPIVMNLALALKLHPLYLMFPVALATSFAFMLPVATPPNAIVYSTGRVQLIEMVKAGFILNVLCLLVLSLGANTWGTAAFDLGTMPNYMRNITAIKL